MKVWLLLILGLMTYSNTTYAVRCAYTPATDAVENPGAVSRGDYGNICQDKSSAIPYSIGVFIDDSRADRLNAGICSVRTAENQCVAAISLDPTHSGLIIDLPQFAEYSSASQADLRPYYRFCTFPPDPSYQYNPAHGKTIPTTYNGVRTLFPCPCPAGQTLTPGGRGACQVVACQQGFVRNKYGVCVRINPCGDYGGTVQANGHCYECRQASTLTATTTAGLNAFQNGVIEHIFPFGSSGGWRRWHWGGTTVYRQVSQTRGPYFDRVWIPNGDVPALYTLGFASSQANNPLQNALLGFRGICREYAPR